jgi:hypothetical protein
MPRDGLLREGVRVVDAISFPLFLGQTAEPDLHVSSIHHKLLWASQWLLRCFGKEDCRQNNIKKAHQVEFRKTLHHSSYPLIGQRVYRGRRPSFIDRMRALEAKRWSKISCICSMLQRASYRKILACENLLAKP